MADSEPAVDYEHAVHVYDRGRSLDDDALTRWAAAVRRRLPHRDLHLVADVGAGTGLFLPMWRDLGAASILAVEPAAGMRARAVARAVRGAHVVAGRADHLPIADDRLDVAWLSTVIHHVGDLDALASELARTLRPGGRVLVRSFFPGHGVVPWLDALGDPERVRTRFPDVRQITGALATGGIEVVAVDAVTEPEGPTAGAAAAWLRTMRAADSILTLYAAAEVDAAVAALDHDPGRRLAPASLTLLTAERA
jgi:ubiquinone/menaquinone biosynthesis C-methylase UbiE